MPNLTSRKYKIHQDIFEGQEFSLPEFLESIKLYRRCFQYLDKRDPYTSEALVYQKCSVYDLAYLRTSSALGEWLAEATLKSKDFRP